MSYEIETDEPIQYQCRHIFTDGRRCASPTLRSPAGHEPFCYYHHTTRRPVPPQDRAPRLRRAAAKAPFTLPLPEDPSSIQLALGQVLQLIASNQLDPRRAGLLLYGLQIASLNLKRNNQTATPRTASPRHRPTEDRDTQDIVTEITLDPDHGLLAPPAELHANEPMGSAQRFLMELCGDDDDLEPPCRHQPAAPQPAATPNLTIDLQASASSTQQKEKAHLKGGLFQNNAGDHLISHTLARAVPSAQRGLTSVFGMGTGGTLAVNSPANRGEAEGPEDRSPKDLLLAFDSKNARGAIVHN